MFLLHTFALATTFVCPSNVPITSFCSLLLVQLHMSGPFLKPFNFAVPVAFLTIVKVARPQFVLPQHTCSAHLSLASLSKINQAQPLLTALTMQIERHSSLGSKRSSSSLPFVDFPFSMFVHKLNPSLIF
jgi:hypothetical protein